MKIPFFNKAKKETAQFVIAFCDTPDLSTKFGNSEETFKTFQEADVIIRRYWPQAQKVKEGCYKLDGGYLIVEKTNQQTLNLTNSKICVISIFTKPVI